MLQRFAEHLSATRLIPEGATVLVAYSGGPDSTCLLHMLKSLEFDVVAAHLNHGQREEAEKEEALGRAFCDDLGIPFVGGKADVPRMASDLKIGLEEAGRRARYQFLRSAAFRLSTDIIATGHTRDDHVETVLLHLVRGSGIRGLSGIPAMRDGIIRPLLPFSRAETQAYCLEHGLWTHDDPANSDLVFSRARIRHNVVPELRVINPAADLAIARLAETAAEEDRFLDGAAAAALEQAEVPLNGDLEFLTLDCEAAFEIAALLSLPAVLFKRGMRLVAKALGGELDHEQTLALVDGILNESAGSVTAEGGDVVIEWGHGKIHARNLQPTQPFRYPLTLPGETESDEFGWVLEGRQIEGTIPGESLGRTSLVAHLDAAKVKGSLYFRSFEDGDRLQPAGFEGTRKVSDLLSEAKLTLAARKRMPIICDILGPVWIPGTCLSERVRTDETTGKTLRLQFRSIRDSETTRRV